MPWQDEKQAGAAIIQELHKLARKGARSFELIAHIRGAISNTEGMITILDYLCKAFSVRLPMILPLREDEGRGSFGRAIEIPFWFAALLLDGVAPLPWDWDVFWKEFGGNFDVEQMHTTRLANGSIQFINPPRQPDNRYVRGVFEVYVDKMEALGPEPKKIFATLQRFTDNFHQTVAPDRSRALSPVRLNLEYQLDEQGPKYRVVCMAQALQLTHEAVESVGAG